MKALLIIGILFLAAGFGLAYAGSKPMTSLSDRGERAYTASMMIGFLLVGISSVLYLRKKS